MSSTESLSSPAQAQKKRWLARHWPHLALVAILALYACGQAANFMPGHTEPDLVGYTWLAKRMAALQPLAVPQPDPFSFQEHPWVETVEGLVTSKYDPGYPLAMALFYKVGGDRAMFLVSPLTGTLTLLGVYLLGCYWQLRPSTALLATLCLGLHGMFLFYSGYMLAHSLDICLLVWGMYFLWRWMDRPAAATGVGAGLALGFAVTVRHSSAVFAAAVLAAFLVAAVREQRQRWRRRPALEQADAPPAAVTWPATLALGLGYLFFPALLALYNTLLFGHPLITGYALSQEQDAFSLALLAENYRDLLSGAQRELFSVTLVLGLFAAVVLDRLGDRLLRLLWIVPLLVLYGCYYWYTPWSSFYRFLLGIFPPALLLSYALADRLQPRWGGRLAAMLLLTVVVLFPQRETIYSAFALELNSRHGQAPATAGRAVAAHFPDDALVLAEGPLDHWPGSQRRFQSYDLAAFQSRRVHDFHPRRPDDLRAVRYGRTQPRRQPQRSAFFRQFYMLHKQAQLTAMRDQLIAQACAQGRQVALLVRSDHEANLARQWRGQWTLESLTQMDLLMSNSDGATFQENWGLYRLQPVVEKPAALQQRP